MVQLLPKLIVCGADEAITFYTKVFGAVLKNRHLDAPGVVVHAELDIDGHGFAVAEANPDWGWNCPAAHANSPVLLTFESNHPDEVAQRMVDYGGNVVIPIDDRPYGKREGRVRDPFGHLWIVSGALVG